MPSPTIPTFTYSKTYDDLTVLSESDLDATNDSVQTRLNTYEGPNLQQLARDCFGITDYQFDQDGVAQYTNNLFDKQYSAKTYNGGNISITTTADAAYASVDAVNAAITFTPEKAGKYKATFTFTHTFSTNATAEGTLETTFVITDGTSTSPAVRSGGYLPATAANSGKMSLPITISYIFDWATTNARTITLQKFNRAATAISSNVVAATSSTGEIYITVEKI